MIDKTDQKTEPEGGDMKAEDLFTGEELDNAEARASLCASVKLPGETWRRVIATLRHRERVMKNVADSLHEGMDSCDTEEEWLFMVNAAIGSLDEAAGADR